MTRKRFCESEVSGEISFKHPRYSENGARNSSPLIVSSLKVVLDNAYMSGNGNLEEDNFEGLEKPGHEIGVVNPEESENCSVARESETGSLCSCAIGSTCEAEKVHELAVHLPLPSEYFCFDSSGRHIHSDDPYSTIFNNPPRKLVPVGPAYQADIPEHSEDIPREGENDVLGGMCVISISDHTDEHEPSPSQNVESHIVAGRSGNCGCPDTGSTSCVKQHITEARGKLRATLGAQAFKELGFYEMGEVVAEKWSEEDEVIFEKVVQANPASLGKNFWDILRLVFPSRRHMELVSYYFNVFILRKRAAQNRYDQMNIDSDDDEWELIDDNRFDYNNDDDGGKSDDEDDSAVESPVHGGVHSHHLDGLDEHVDDNAHQSLPSSHFLEMGQEMVEKDTVPHYGDNDVQDRSCTSFDFGFPAQVVPPPAEANGDCNKDWRGVSSMEPCGDVKAWEYTITSCSKTDSVEFLPTCSVIEEVFGDGSSSLSFQTKG